MGILGEDASIAANTKTDSILATLRAHIRQLSVFAEKDGDWSAREWVNSPGAGNLYIMNSGKDDTSFTTVITLLLDLIAREIKEFPDSGSQNAKVVFVIDELGALPAMSTLGYLLREGRSKGVAVIIANQSFSEIKAVYKAEEAMDIFTNCKSRFFFNLHEPTDAKYVADSIGSAEVERSSSNTTTSNGMTTVTINKTIVSDKVVLPETIENLKVGQAAVQLPALLPNAAIVPFKPAPVGKKVNAGFLPVRPDEVKVKDIASMSLRKIAKSELSKKAVEEPFYM